MPDRQLGDWIESYMAFTSNTEPPELYRKWVALSVIAACLQRKCFIDMEHLTVFPNLYTVLVGPPGARKGTAMVVGLGLLEDLGIKVAAEAITRQALIRDLFDACQFHPDPRDPTKIYTHSSLTIYSEELTVFLGFNNSELMSDLSNWFDCRNRWKYRTKHEGTDDIMGVWVNLLGATTPELLQSSLPKDTIGSGLASRIIFVYEDRKGKVVAPPNLFIDKELKSKLLIDLEQIHMLAGQYKFTESYSDDLVAWYLYQDKHPPFEDPDFLGYCQRRAIHVMKASMILNAARTSSMVLDSQDLKGAINLLEATEVNMRRTFSGVGQSNIASLSARIIEFLKERKSSKLSELMERFYRDADRVTLGRALSTLEAMGICKISIKDNPNDWTVIYIKKEATKNGKD